MAGLTANGAPSVAVVTGAAGGIGRAVVAALARAGTAVAALDRCPDGLDALVADTVADTAADAADHCGRVEPIVADVSDPASVEAAFDAAEHRLGPVEALVSTAGVLHEGPVRSFGDAQWAATFAVNVTGVFHCSRAAVARMAPRGRGSLVTVASNAAATPRVEMSAYAASKAAAVMFTKSLGLEVARDGIRANVVAPGSTDTAMLRSLWHDEHGPVATLDGDLEAYRVGIPLGRIAAPPDVASAVEFLLSERARHITMAVLTVDGGASLGA